ncbi:hypothetical protein Tco_0159724, partial [Tanacetum coccineum]
MVQDGRVVVQDVRRIYNTTFPLKSSTSPFQRNNARGNVVAGNVGGHIARECPRPKRLQDSDYFKDKMLLMQAQVNEMLPDEEHTYVVDSDADYTSNSNIIPYDQYVEDNEDHVVQRNVSSVRNDALMSILDEMHEQGVQSRLANKPNMIINDSVASELARNETSLKSELHSAQILLCSTVGHYKSKTEEVIILKK